MKLFTNVKGIKIKDMMIKPSKFDVRITSDELGVSLSITNMKENMMFQIPITKSMLRELMKDD